jgi:hypothetical protein
MLSLHTAPILLYTLIGVLLGLLVWGFLLNRSHNPNRVWSDAPDYLRFWLLLLAVFSMGAFVALTLEMLLLLR